jgi:hypothetical protein
MPIVLSLGDETSEIGRDDRDRWASSPRFDVAIRPLKATAVIDVGDDKRGSTAREVGTRERGSRYSCPPWLAVQFSFIGRVLCDGDTGCRSSIAYARGAGSARSRRSARDPGDPLGSPAKPGEPASRTPHKPTREAPLTR